MKRLKFDVESAWTLTRTINCNRYYVGTIEQLPSDTDGTPLMLGWVERMWGRGGLPDGIQECQLELEDGLNMTVRERETHPSCCGWIYMPFVALP